MTRSTRLMPSIGNTSTYPHYMVKYIAITLVCLSIARTSAAPVSTPAPPRTRLQNRQAIPDVSGNTGNAAQPVQPIPPPLPPPSTPTIATITPSSNPASIPIPIPTWTSTSTPTPTPVTPTATQGGNGGDDGTANTPTNPAEKLKLTRLGPALSPGALVGILCGSALALVLLLALATFLLRRRRRPKIAEIAIRRSRLGVGAMLRRRMFSSPLPASRSSGRALTGDSSRKEWLRKDSIGRPEPATWGRGQMLSVPVAPFVKSEKESVEDGERWIDKGLISEPRPARPRSAEPLGRLSGMGMGMGYLR